MSHWAYLVGVLDVTASPPRVVGVSIYSEGAGDVTIATSQRFPFDILRWPGETYAEAEEGLREALAKPGYRRIHGWALAWLEAGDRGDLEPPDAPWWEPSS